MKPHGDIPDQIEAEYVSVKEVAMLCGLSARTVTRHVAMPDCPSFRASGLRKRMIHYTKYVTWLKAGGADRKQRHKSKAQNEVRKEAESYVQ